MLFTKEQAITTFFARATFGLEAAWPRQASGWAIGLSRQVFFLHVYQSRHKSARISRDSLASALNRKVSAILQSP